MPPVVRTSSPTGAVDHRLLLRLSLRCGRIMSTYITPSISTMMIRNSTVPPPVGRRAERVPRPEGRERAPLDRRSRARGQVEYEPQIMQAQQPKPEHLPLRDEVAHVGAGEALAGRAVALGVERARITGETRRCEG